MKYCILFSLLLLFSCEQEKVEPPEECNAYILAGDKESGCIKHRVYEPSIDVSPEYYEGDAQYTFDVQGDGVPDFLFKTSSWSAWGGEGKTSEIVPLDGGSVTRSPVNETWAAKFWQGTIIDSSSSWSNELLTFSYEYTRYELEGEQEYSHTVGGEWLSMHDSAYIGLRVIDNFDTIYAWVYMSAVRAFIGIHEYAYLEKE